MMQHIDTDSADRMIYRYVNKSAVQFAPPPRAGLLSSIMLFNLYDSFLFFLLFILPGPSMVSAELPPLLPKGLIRLPSIPKEHWLDATYLRVPVPGKTVSRLEDQISVHLTYAIYRPIHSMIHGT